LCIAESRNKKNRPDSRKIFKICVKKKTTEMTMARTDDEQTNDESIKRAAVVLRIGKQTVKPAVFLFL
jgi:hypothetical protein